MDEQDQEVNKQNQAWLQTFAEKMKKADMPQPVIDLFLTYLKKLHSSTGLGMISDNDIQPIQAGELPQDKDLTLENQKKGEELLDKAVVIKLNGGLGTSMGMPYAKSLLEAKAGYTFLDLIILQSEFGVSCDQKPIPLVLMDSFNTHQDTKDYFKKKKIPKEKQPLSFLQHQYPKVLTKDLSPADWPEDPELEWNPPGHGDIYSALYTSGILDDLLDQGKRYAFISNADNLGAVIETSILGFFAQNGFPFLMEVARRTPMDKKGGHLAKSKEGGYILREVAQCPDKELDKFQDIDLYSYFNTNNIWLDLKKLKEHISENGLPVLPLIVNPKTLNPRDESSPKVFQLETAMGAAISTFPGSGVLEVDRQRLIPVKKTNDLLAVRSDCYILDQGYTLIPNPKRKYSQITIDLDSTYYKKIDQFEQRFPSGPPYLFDCQSLVVQGDVVFEKDVICSDQVKIINRTEEQKRIQKGTKIQGQLILD